MDLIGHKRSASSQWRSVALSFDTVKVGETIVLPGRIGKPDSYEVTRKYANRLFLESALTPGSRRVMTSNQFNAAGFEAAVPDESGFATVILDPSIPVPPWPDRDPVLEVAEEDDGAEHWSDSSETRAPLDPELAELRRKYGE